MNDHNAQLPSHLTSIHQLATLLIPFQGCEELEPVPADIGREAAYTLVLRADHWNPQATIHTLNHT